MRPRIAPEPLVAWGTQGPRSQLLWEGQVHRRGSSPPLTTQGHTCTFQAHHLSGAPPAPRGLAGSWASLQPTSPQKLPRQGGCQSRLLAQPRLVLGRGKEQWTRPPSTSQTSLPGAGTKDGGREGRRQRGSWPVHPQHTQSQFCPAHRFHSNAHPHRATPGGCTHPSVQRCTNSSIHTVVHTLPGTTGTPTRYTLTGAHTHRSLLPEEPNPSLHLLSATWCWRGGNPTQNVPPRVNQTGGRS